MKEDGLQDALKQFQKVYDEMLADEGWQQSSFLKIMHAKLVQLRKGLEKHVQSEETKTGFGIESNQAISAQQDFQMVYIYLYTTEGKRLDAWQRVISNLDKHYISRPIYRSELDAQHAVLNAPIMFNAGYVAILVNKKFIFPEDNSLKDKFGHDLLTLKDRAIQLNQINYFWTNFSQYKWNAGKLLFSKLVERLQK